MKRAFLFLPHQCFVTIFLGLTLLSLAPITWSQERCEAPVWNVGDKWTFRDSTETWIREVVDVKEDVFILKFSTDLLGEFDKKTLHNTFMVEKSGRRRMNTDDPTRKLYDFPYFVGKTWEDRVSFKPRAATTEFDYLNEFKIERFEEIKVTAGTFKTYVVHYTQSIIGRSASGWMRYWYSPEAKYMLKREAGKSPFWPDRFRDGYSCDSEIMNLSLTN
jgi:hypothetical protein